MERLPQDGLFFTSDHHWGHSNIIKYCCRTEFATPEEKRIILYGMQEEKKRLVISAETTERMDEEMILRWNQRVGVKDTVYHLGDIFLGSGVERAKEIRNRLNGTIHLILGNHDRLARSMRSSFASMREIAEIKVEDSSAKDGVRRVVLMHYAMRVWNQSHGGAYHLYGHSHHTLREDPEALSLDVGVDGWDYTPVSFARIREYLAGRSPSQQRGFDTE